jgi:hypothetical protein
MNTNNNNRGKRAVRTGRIRKCFWFAEPDASSQAAFSSNAEKCIAVNLSGLPQGQTPDGLGMDTSQPAYIGRNAERRCAVQRNKEGF